MNILLIYSNKCPHSNSLKKFNIFNKINKLNIDEEDNIKHIPEYIDSVPILVIKNNNNLSLLKEDNLLEWFMKNSDNNNNNNNNQPNTKKNNEDVLESNMLDSNFSCNFTFLEGGNDDILENNYSSLDSTNNPINTDSNINISTKKDSSLDSDYEKLMKQRGEEFKSIERF